MSFLLSYEKTDIHYYLNQYVGNKFLNIFFFYVTYLGDGNVAVLILLAIIICNVRLGIYTTVTFLSASLFAIALKRLFFSHIDRPSWVFKNFDPRDLTLVDGVEQFIHNSFPSGHATQAFAIFMCLVFTVKNPFYKLLLFALAFLTAISRVYLSQHWLNDITAGSTIGVIFSILFYYLLISKNKLQQFDKPLYRLKKNQLEFKK
jgi:membrane-associated phospholipid phosphatase